MCGINGFITDQPIKDKLLIMNNLIFHRGPDESGEYFAYNGSFHVGMAMRRLSIIDLTNGKQPLYSNDKSKVIFFNGEIYNYKQLKEDLVSKGYTFSTESDTEVVVNLYEFYGERALGMLDGMFAFSIYDIAKDSIIIARDFFGEKPIYYYHGDNKFIWASELKSILSVLSFKPSIDAAALNLYFQLTYIPAPFTIYNGIRKLEANHYLRIECKTLEYNISEIAQNFKNYDDLTYNTSVKKTHDLVYQSVSSRSVADQPVGTFLSGGIDSSIVSFCLSEQNSTKINTFSIGFEKKEFNETDKSQTVANLINSNHHEFIVESKDLYPLVGDLLHNFDEPFADSSALPMYLLSLKTKDKVSVALTGDGGDEVFGGYNKYHMGALNNMYTRIWPKVFHERFLKTVNSVLRTSDDNRGYRFKVNRFLNAVNYEGDYYYNIISLGFQKVELSDLFLPKFLRNNALDYYKNKLGKAPLELSDFRNVDRILSLEGDLLVKADRSSMLASLECRAPFLNKEIWNFTHQLPDSFLIDGNSKKKILKDAFSCYFPKGFFEQSKKGFGVPVGDWFREELKLEILSFVNKNFVIEQNLFQFDVVRSLVINHVEGKVDNTFKVWTYYCFQKWYISNYSA
jgi:asparagine synthase (glutamine-hydrolysing)